MTGIGQWIDLLGAIPILALGVYVLTVKPRRRASVWLAAFTLGTGFYTAWSNGSALFLPDFSGDAWFAVALAFSFLWFVSIVGLASAFPTQLSRRDRASVALSFGVAVAVAVALLHNLPSLGFSRLGEAWLVVAVLDAASLIGYAFLLALRYRAAASEDERRSLRLAAAAMTVYMGFIAGFGYDASGGNGILKATGATVGWGWGTFLPGVALGLLWVVTMVRRNDRAARAMAWLTFGMIAVGLWFSAGTPYRGGFGVTRVIVTGMLVYAIVKHQVLGIDVKLRWTISKGTVAAIFVAAFFVTSEAAQQFFGDRFESDYLGILGAGALVFAVAPLSRLADRFAEKAVPVGQRPATSPTLASEQEDAYRSAVRLALRDRGLTRDEERELFRLARGLGLPAERAHEILSEVERAREESGSRAAEQVG